jgi:BirA family biotin operon repressor/biotin-[acetyl-CoA-carboxylase] ligase
MTEPAADWGGAARPSRRIGRRIEAHGTIASTNDRARELLDEPEGAGTVVVAEAQTAGRGRRGRTWDSPPGVNLLVSVALRPRLPAERAWQLGQAIALAAADACASRASVWLKWPNDIVAADGAKLGGLLIETVVEGDRVAGTVAGIGINVNWPRARMPEAIAGTATSLLDLAGTPIDRVALLGDLLERLEDEIARLEAGTSPLSRYRARCATLGRDVAVGTPEGLVEGMAVDVDAQGALVVRTHGGPRHISSGEVVRVRDGVPA